jgi:hypothetical protein
MAGRAPLIAASALAVRCRCAGARKILVRQRNCGSQEGLVDATIKEYKAADIKGTKEDRDTAYRNAVKAGELRLKIEARLGDLIKQEQKAGRLATKGRPGKYDASVIFLKDIGLTLKDSERAQRVAKHQDLIPVVVARATMIRKPMIWQGHGGLRRKLRLAYRYRTA